MDGIGFGALLHLAKKNSDETKEQQQQDGKFYSTKYSPPKKITKQSKELSNNIQKFLKKKEAEEAALKREKNQKVAELMAKRDEKSKNKIRKMLKVTKSANKSVLDDAKEADGTSAAAAEAHEAGEGQGDDYGYTSNEANALYDKYLEKMRGVQETKVFSPSRPKSLRDLSGTKERVKAAIDRERQEAESHTRQRRTGSSASITPSTSKASSSSSSSGSSTRSSGVARAYSTTKTLYDPEAEKREEENKKQLAEEQKRARLKRAAQPPPMDFQSLLRLAEKKQHEPVVFAEPERKKEPERLLSAKEKREAEERQRQKEQRAQRDKLRESGDKPKLLAVDSKAKPIMNGGRIPKLSQAKPSSPAPAKSPSDAAQFKRPAQSPVKATSSSHSSSSILKPVASTKLASGSTSTTNNKTSAAASVKTGTSSGAAAAAAREKPTCSGSKATPLRNPYAEANKNGGVREFPPRDRPAVSGTGPAAAKNAQKRAPPPADARGKQRPKPTINKRRICDDDDDSEYDSELDDFIDDGDCEEDISSHIRKIFGYDKRRYRDQDDDDRGMESSFAQMQREEFISKKLGLQEDLEDMRMEALHKKRKMAKQSQRIGDDDD